MGLKERMAQIGVWCLRASLILAGDYFYWRINTGLAEQWGFKLKGDQGTDSVLTASVGRWQVIWYVDDIKVAEP